VLFLSQGQEEESREASNKAMLFTHANDFPHFSREFRISRPTTISYVSVPLCMNIISQVANLCQSTLTDFIKWQAAKCIRKTAHCYFRICQQCAEISLTLCEVSGSHSRVAEDSGLLICYIMSTDKYLLMFRKIQVPLSSG
jgi:hypothetical protein